MRTQIDAIRADLRDGRTEVRDLGSEFAGIAGDLRTLVRTELELAKSEAKEQAGYLVALATWGGIAVAAAVVTLAWVALTSTYALSGFFPLWLSALVVTAGLALIAGLSALVAKARATKLSVVPRRTLNAVKEDVSWARHQLKSNSTSNGNGTR
ncbi:MAG: phage holin family protein [Anaerolineaceae bacterium]